MSKALLEITKYDFESMNVLEHSDKIIIKVKNYDIKYD